MVVDGFREAFEKGEAFAIQGLHVKAVDAFSKALNYVEAEEFPKAFAVTALRAGEQAHRAGWHEEALGFFQQVAVCDAVPIQLRLRASTHRSVLAMGCSDVRDAYDALIQSLKLAQDAGDVAAEAQHQGNLGLILLRMGEVRSARSALYEAAKLYGEAGDLRNQAQSWNALGNVLLRLGDAVSAEAHFQDAYKALKNKGTEAQSAIPLANIAHLMRRRGETREALELYREVYAAMIGQGDLRAGSLLDVAMAELDLGNWQIVDEHLKEAASQAESAAMQARIDFVRIDWFSETGEYQEALDCGERILRVFEERGDIQGIVGVHLSRTRINWLLGQPTEPFPDEVYRVELPELKIAVQSLNAERAFAANRLETAREILTSFKEPLESLKHLNRVRRIKNLMLTIDLLEGNKSAEEVLEAFITNARAIGEGGNVRDVVAVTIQLSVPLIFLGHLDEAKRIIEPVLDLMTQQWPRRWTQEMERIHHLQKAISGESVSGYVPPETQVIQSRAIDGFIVAVQSRNKADFENITKGLGDSERHLLASLVLKSAKGMDFFR